MAVFISESLGRITLPADRLAQKGDLTLHPLPPNTLKGIAVNLRNLEMVEQGRI